MSHTRRFHFFAMLAATFFSVAETPCIHADEPTGSAAARSKSVTAGPLRFEERLIRGKYGYAYGIAAADLDADGDLDLTSSDTTNDLLLWFENDGKGNLTQRLIYEKDPGWFERHSIADINGDGHLDVAIVKNKVGDLLWFENSGKPRDGKLWKRHVITKATLPGVYDVTLGDFDGDGDLDCAVSSYARGNLFAWYENHGQPATGKPWTMHFIEKNITGTRTIEAVDINRDGKLDLLGTGRLANVILWYENTGKPGAARWRKRIIDDQSPHPTHGHAVDMDRDGDLDVVMALGMHAAAGVKHTHQVAWYENVGKHAKGEKWKKHPVGDLFFGFEAVAGDLDGDQDIDIVGTAWGAESGKLMWYENPGDPRRSGWKAHLLKDKWTNANSVIVMDLDQDGKLDIAATAERTDNEFRWWRNLGRTKGDSE